MPGGMRMELLVSELERTGAPVGESVMVGPAAAAYTDTTQG